MTANPANSPVTGLGPGDKLDKYEIVEQVAVGGTAVVWKGYDRLLDRNVALKQFLPTSGDPEALRDAFRNELAVQKRVATSHRNLIRVLDFIDDQRGMFLVMEYVDGHSLEQILAGHPEPMEERQALGIVGAVALALEAIHASGVIHRDLKPSNIMLPHQGGLKVGDFGLAAVMAEQDALSIGSVRYMAPELFGEDIENANPDARADIYSLGMIAYEMLAGRAKFEDAFKVVLRDKRNQSLRWMKWHTNARAKAPALHDINPAISQTLSDLVARMMEKDRELRIGSAGDLLGAIRRHFAHGAADEEPQPTKIDPKVAAKMAQRSAAPTAPLPHKSRRWQWVLATVAVLLFLCILGLVFLKPDTEKEAIAKAKLESRNAFNHARTVLQANNYREAKAAFDEISRKWPDDELLGKGSEMRSLYAEANILAESEKFKEALAALDKVDESGVFKDSRDVIESRRRKWSDELSFLMTLDQVSKQIDAGSLDSASQLLEELRRYAVSESSAKRRDEKAVQLELKKKQIEIDRVLAQAKTLEPNDVGAAIARLTAANEKYRSPRITDEVDRLTRLRDLNIARFALRNAERTGDKRAIVEAYQAWLKLQPDDSKADSRLKATLADMDVEEGRRLLSTGDKAGAEKRFRHAQGLVSDHTEAARELSLMKIANEKQALLSAGDQAYNAEDYDAAANYYEQLLKAGDDAGVRQKMMKSRARALLKRASDLIAQNSVKEATDALKEALNKDPDLTEAKRQLEAIDRRTQYLRHIEAGNKARSEGDLASAKREYLKAKDILNSKQVQELLNDVEYEWHIAQARAQLNARKFEAALGLATIAQGIRNNDEVRALIDEIKTRKKQNEG